MSRAKTVRRDARETLAKLEAAAREIFLAKGLDAPLEEIARTAGVSIGTLYYRFKSREDLIDTVMPDVVGARLETLRSAVLAEDTPRQRLEAFVIGMIDLQCNDPALNDAILRRYPDAVTLLAICDRVAELARRLVAEAHADGSLGPGVTEHDLHCLLWLAGTASRDPVAPEGWLRVVERALSTW
jgi:AcrR family transcriptional regulator